MEEAGSVAASTSVLLLDDNLELVQCLETILKGFGFYMRAAANPEQLFKMIEQQKPDVILLDARLQQADGLVICKKLKDSAAYTDIAVIIISGYLHLKDSAQLHGADDFLAKPFGLDELIQKINQHVALRRERLAV